MAFIYPGKKLRSSIRLLEGPARGNSENLTNMAKTFFEGFARNSKSLKSFDTSSQEKKPLFLKKGFSKKTMEALYKSGFDFFGEKKYEQAFRLFQLMAYYDYSDLRGWKGMAASLYALKKFSAAAKIFSYLAERHPEDLEALFQNAKCHAALRDFPKVEKVLEKIIFLSTHKIKYKDLRNQAFLLKALLPC